MNRWYCTCISTPTVHFTSDPFHRVAANCTLRDRSGASKAGLSYRCTCTKRSIGRTASSFSRHRSPKARFVSFRLDVAMHTAGKKDTMRATPRKTTYDGNLIKHFGFGGFHGGLLPRATKHHRKGDRCTHGCTPWNGRPIHGLTKSIDKSERRSSLCTETGGDRKLGPASCHRRIKQQEGPLSIQ
jgi:hypothetical protein